MYNFNKIYIQVSEIQKSEQHRFESQAASIKSNCSSHLTGENTAYDEILLTAVLNSNIYHTFKFPQIPVCFAESTYINKKCKLCITACTTCRSSAKLQWIHSSTKPTLE